MDKGLGLYSEAAAAVACRNARDVDGGECEPRADAFYVRVIAEGRLTRHQRAAFDAVLAHVDRAADAQEIGFFRIEAEAGAGKTFLANALTAAVRAAGGRVVCSAYTAKAATNYADGTTCHRTFNLNVTTPSQKPVTELARSGCGKAGRAGARLARAALVIVDEVTMMKASELDAIVAGLRSVRFAGALVLLGNNAQLSCVIERASTGDVITHHVTSSRTYRRERVSHFRLCVNMRMAGDKAFRRACHEIGYKRLPAEGDIVGHDGSHLVRLDRGVFDAVPDNGEADSSALRDVREWAHPAMFGRAPRYVLDGHLGFNTLICATRAVEKDHNMFYLSLLGAQPRHRRCRPSPASCLRPAARARGCACRGGWPRCAHVPITR